MQISALFRSPQMSLKDIRLFFTALLLLFANNAMANTGGLRVSLEAVNSNQRIPDATVVAESRNGERETSLTDENGEAYFSELPAGLYEIEVSAEGYQARRFPSTRVVSNKITPLVVAMSLLDESLEEVLVVGSAIAQADLKSVGTSVIDREGLRSSAGSGSDVLRALDGLPGLFSSGEYSSFTVRGNGPRDNLILVDGIPFDNVVHFSDSYGEQEELEGGGRYSVFAPNVIAQAEFEPGGWSAAYGGKSGSLLKLEVAEGNRDTASFTTRLDIAGIEVGYDGPSGLHANTSMLFSARDLDFGRLFESVGLDEVGTPTLTDVILKTSTELENDGKFNFLVIYAPEDYTRDIDNVLASDEENDPGNYEDVELAKAEKDNALITAHWEAWHNNIQFNNRLYYRYLKESASNGEAYPDLVPENTPKQDIPVREDILLSKREETETGWRFDMNLDNRIGRLNTGLRISQTELDFNLTLTDNWILYTFEQNDFRPNDDIKYIELSPESVNSSYNQTSTNYALYADQEFNISNWTMRIGARYDRDGLSEENLISPRWGASWPVSSKLRFSATAGRYFQAPRFNDRASDPTNKDLENEQIDQFSLGLNYRLTSNLNLFIEPYYQLLDNLVTEQDGVNQTFANTGEGTSYGFDTALTRSFNNGWSADIKYSYNHAKTKDSPTDKDYDADFNRPHSFSIGGVWEISERWKLSSRWKWASGTPKDESIIHENVLGDGEPLRYSKEYVTNNTDRFDSFSSLNFRADYRRSWGRTQLIAFVDIINVLGAENPSTEEFNERAGKDEVEEGEMLPLIGLRFEW